MLKKLMLGAVACSMVLGFSGIDANARGKDCCSPCHVAKVHKVRCPKPKCVKPHHHACCSDAKAACASGCGHAADVHHMAPVAEHAPMPATAAPVEAPPSPSAADAPK